MSRADRESQARIDGMYYAVKRIQEIGIEDFQKELAYRGRCKIGIVDTSLEELRKAMTSMYEEQYLKNCILTMLVLKDEFGFDKPALRRFNARCNVKTECLIQDYADWKDYAQILKDEDGIDFSINWQ